MITPKQYIQGLRHRDINNILNEAKNQYSINKERKDEFLKYWEALITVTNYILDEINQRTNFT